VKLKCRAARPRKGRDKERPEQFDGIDGLLYDVIDGVKGDKLCFCQISQ
jgi:hypothetical protein